jgi:hypothetical protein
LTCRNFVGRRRSHLDHLLALLLHFRLHFLFNLDRRKFFLNLFLFL